MARLRKQILRLDQRWLIARVIMRSAIGFFASFTVSSGVLAANVLADPADDALAKLNELSRQAEQTTEALHSAQLDLNEKLAAQRAADQKLADNRTALDAARARLATFQTAVNKVAAATYMGGRTHGMDAILTAESPQLLIDRLSVQRVMAHQMSTQMARFKAAGEQAVKAEQAAAKSAADARSAAEQAAAVRANLQHKQSQLQVQIAVVKSQYVALTPEERPGCSPACQLARVWLRCPQPWSAQTPRAVSLSEEWPAAGEPTPTASPSLPLPTANARQPRPVAPSPSRSQTIAQST